MDQCYAQRDEQRAHDQRSDDAPEQHLVLVLTVHAEIREQQQEDEQVVDTEGFLDQVTREKLQRRARAEPNVEAEVEA